MSIMRLPPVAAALRGEAQVPIPPPHSPATEKALIGACLIAQTARTVLARELAPDDFYVPACAAAAEAIIALHRLGMVADPITVSDWLAAHHGRGDTLSFLMDCMADTPATTSAATYARIIRDRASRRALLTLADDMGRAAHDTTTELGDLTEGLGADLRSLDRPNADAEGDLNIEEFLSRPVAYHWLVPGLLERRDRLVITGFEGRGKSTLLRQLAVQFAAGVHPFRSNVVTEPIRVLYLDLENSEMQSHRKFSKLMANVNRQPIQPTLEGAAALPTFDPDRLRIRCRPGGMDLRMRSDQRWFAERITANRPDVVITGPLYKLHRGNPNDEEHAAAVTALLDDLRTTYDFALILEAHSPHGAKDRPLRPRGASLWMGWPEFGFGLRPDEGDSQTVEWEPWRGARDEERHWPRRLTYGVTWPWVNAAGSPALIAASNGPGSDEEPF